MKPKKLITQFEKKKERILRVIDNLNHVLLKDERLSMQCEQRQKCVLNFSTILNLLCIPKKKKKTRNSISSYF